MPTNHQVVEEALDALARQPWGLALMDRCIGCDSRSASLRGGRCPECLAYSYEMYDVEAEDRIRERGARLRMVAGDRGPESSTELSHPFVTLEVAS